MSEVRYLQWRNSNDKDKYPFQTEVSLTNGSVFIPENLFADARLYPIGGNEDQYLSRIVKTAEKITIYISDPGTLNLASCVYEIASPPDKLLHLVDRFGRSAGVLVTDSLRLTTLLGFPDGVHDFDSDQTRFSADVVTPMPQAGVRSLRIDEEEALSGDVYLIGGTGVVLEVDDYDPREPIVTVNAVGEPMFRRLLCAEVGFTPPCTLKTINGIPPDEFGNFMFMICGVDTDNTLIRIERMENGIRIFTVGGRLASGAS